MKVLAVFIIGILTATALSIDEQWVAFKKDYNKSYDSVIQERLRAVIFQSNLKRISEHNAKYEKGEVSYYMGLNKFADMTAEEFKSMLQLQISDKPTFEGSRISFSDDNVPDAIDWRTRGAVSEVKDQGACGSCWAFSTTGGVESQLLLKNNVSLLLSEQELLDCTGLWDNNGCYGGFITSSYSYIRQMGLSSNESYPYVAADGSCNRDASNVVVRISDYKILEEKEESLKNAIGTVGPISVRMTATENLQLYQGGIFEDFTCTNFQSTLNHAVLAVGYDNDNGKNYWIIKNSWGLEWGEEGFFRMQRDPSICGIYLDASYPIL